MRRSPRCPDRSNCVTLCHMRPYGPRPSKAEASDVRAHVQFTAVADRDRTKPTKQAKMWHAGATRFCIQQARRPKFSFFRWHFRAIQKIRVFPVQFARFVELDKQMMTGLILRLQVSPGLRYRRYRRLATNFQHCHFDVLDGRTCGISNISSYADWRYSRRPAPSTHCGILARPNFEAKWRNQGRSAIRQSRRGTTQSNKVPSTSANRTSGTVLAVPAQYHLETSLRVPKHPSARQQPCLHQRGISGNLMGASTNLLARGDKSTSLHRLLSRYSREQPMVPEISEIAKCLETRGPHKRLSDATILRMSQISNTPRRISTSLGELRSAPECWPVSPKAPSVTNGCQPYHRGDLCAPSSSHESHETRERQFRPSSRTLGNRSSGGTGWLQWMTEPRFSAWSRRLPLGRVLIPDASRKFRGPVIGRSSPGHD